MRFSYGLLALMVGCAYVTEEELESALDQDADGWLQLGTNSLGEPVENSDCNDADAFFYPGAIDVRGDGCDSDCGAEPDSDGDDWPDSSDCAPNDANIYPCAAGEVDGDGVDSDCDGRDSVRWVDCATADPTPRVWDAESESFIDASDAVLASHVEHLASLATCVGDGGTATGTPPDTGDTDTDTDSGDTDSGDTDSGDTDSGDTDTDSGDTDTDTGVVLESELWLSDASNGDLYTLNTATNSTTKIATGIGYFDAFAWEPVSQLMWATNINGAYTINPATYKVTTVNGSATDFITALAWDGDSIVAMVDGNSKIYDFDMTTGKLGGSLFDTGRTDVKSLTWDPTFSVLYAVTASEAGESELLTIDISGSTVNVVGSTGLKNIIGSTYDTTVNALIGIQDVQPYDIRVDIALTGSATQSSPALSVSEVSATAFTRPTP